MSSPPTTPKRDSRAIQTIDDLGDHLGDGTTTMVGSCLLRPHGIKPSDVDIACLNERAYARITMLLLLGGWSAIKTNDTTQRAQFKKEGELPVDLFVSERRDSRFNHPSIPLHLLLKDYTESNREKDQEKIHILKRILETHIEDKDKDDETKVVSCTRKLLF